jgi:hypothetical protein
MGMVIGSTRFFGSHRFRRRSRLQVCSTTVLVCVGGRFWGDGICALGPRFLRIGAPVCQGQWVSTCENAQPRSELGIFSLTRSNDDGCEGWNVRDRLQ